MVLVILRVRILFTTMFYMTTVEQLKQQNDTIQLELDALKQETDKTKKTEKNADLLKKAEALKWEINKKIEELKTKTDAASLQESELVKSELERTESVLSFLKINKNELWTLQQEVADKNIAEKTVDWINGDETENYHTAKKAGRGTLVVGWIVAGATLVWKGIKSLFGWGKKEKSETEEKPKKSRWKRALAWTGGIIGGTWLGRGLITGKWDLFWRNPFSREKKEGPEVVPGSDLTESAEAYEKLSEGNRKLYEESAEAINSYQGNIMNTQGGAESVEDMLWDSDFDTGKEGLIPFVLNNRYASLDKMLGETAFYYEILGTEWNIAWDKLKNWGLDKLQAFFLPLLTGLDATTFGLLKTAKTVDEFLEKMKSLPNAEEIARTAFRKSISVMSYYQSRKRALECQLAEQELSKADPNFANLSEEEKAEKIADQLENETRYAEHIESEIKVFMSKNLKDATTYLQEKNLLDGEVDPLVQKSVDKVENRRKDVLEIDDEDDLSNLSELKSELQNWKLSEKAQKKLEKICENFEEEMEDAGRQSWYMRYLPMFHILGADEQTLHQIQQTGDYDRIIGIYKQQMQEVLKKSKDWTLSESDFDTLEHTINDYYAFQKSLVSSQVNMSKAIDENGNLLMRRGNSIMVWGQNIWSWIQIIIGKESGTGMEAGALIGWGILSIDALTFGLAGRKTLGFSPFRMLNKKVIFPIAKTGLKLTGDGIARLTGNAMRAHLPGLVPSSFYNKDTFRIAVGRGDISLERAARIAKSKKFSFWATISGNGATVETPEQVIQYLFWSSQQEAKRVANIVEKFWDNPKVYHQLFPEYYDKVDGRRRKPKEWFNLNRANMKFDLNFSALEKLENIAIRIEALPNGAEKEVLKSMMKSVRNLEQAEYIATMGVGDDMAKMLASGKMISAEKYGKYLAKYAGKIDANDLRAFENFLIDAQAKGKIGKNQDLFARNALKNFEKIKAKWFAIDNIDDIWLNASKWSRIAESTKANTNKMVASLEKMKANPRFKPFWKGIWKQAEALKAYSQTITPEGMKAMKDISRLDKVSGFSKLSPEGIHELSRLSYMLRDVDTAKELGKLLSKTKNLDEMKLILIDRGIDVSKIDDAILLKMAKTKNAKKIADIVNYWAEFKAISWFKKLIQNPAIKYTGRLIGKGFVIADVALVGFNFYAQKTEAEQIKQTNLERGEWKENQAYFELWTGGLWAAAGACMFIPGAGWVAAGVLVAAMWVQEVGKKYYQDIEKFKQNQSDFLVKGIASTKQELTSLDSWDQGLSRTWIDAINLWGSATKKEIGSPKTKAEALRALIKMEELQKNPLAGADLNDPEVVKDSELTEQVRLAKVALEDVVEKRFAYFQKEYIDTKKPLIKKEKFWSYQAISEIELALEASSVSAVMSADEHYTWEQSIEKYKESLKSKLKAGNESNFNKLEKLFNENQLSLIEMYAQLPYYRAILMNYGEGDQQKLSASCDYFQQYIQYKMLGKSLDKRPKIALDEENIDYRPIHNLLSHFALIPNVVEQNELQNTDYLTDKMLLDEYGVSGNIGQNILFDCAKILSYSGKNNLEELKHFFHEGKKEVYWIYFNGKHWAINENNGSDDEFALDSELNSLSAIEKMKSYINANVNGNFLNGAMFIESKEVNKELGNNMLTIIWDHLKLRKGVDWIKEGIKNYIKTHAVEGKYISIPLELIIKAKKAGIENAGASVYSFDGWKVTSSSSIPWVKNPF